MKTVYKNNANNSVRYLLGIKGENPLCVFGINPSLATDKKSDLTVSKIQYFSKLNGYDGYYIFNIYPLRATNPHALHQRRNSKLNNKNIDVIKETLSSLNHINIWAAWGNTILIKPYLLGSLQLIVKSVSHFKIQWYRCGELTKRGHPRHPSRLAYNNKFYPFNIEKYSKHCI